MVQKLEPTLVDDKNFLINNKSLQFEIVVDDSLLSAAIKLNSSLTMEEIKLNVKNLEDNNSAGIKELVTSVKSIGIVCGIELEEAIIIACEHPGVKVEFVQGVASEPGEKGRLVLYDLCEKINDITEVEKIDYKNISNFIIVEKNTVIGKIVAATEGKPGYDVFGREISAAFGQECELPKLENIYIENNMLFANIYGQLDICSDCIKICPLLTIEHDVDMSSGNIHFNGSVLIKGSVQPGFTVVAEDNIHIDSGCKTKDINWTECAENFKVWGDLHIEGAVVGANIRGNNIFIKQGVNGRNGGKIIARKNIFAKYLENAHVYAGGTVEVSDAILFSTVWANEDVIVTRGHGLIAGGNISAGGKIVAKQFGLPATTHTELMAGIKPQVRSEIYNITAKLCKVNDEIPKAKSTLDWLKKQSDEKEKQALILKLTKRIFRLEWEKQNYENLLKGIQDQPIINKETKISASKICYSGIKVTLGYATRLITTFVKNALFVLRDDEVRIGGR